MAGYGWLGLAGGGWWLAGLAGLVVSNRKTAPQWAPFGWLGLVAGWWVNYPAITNRPTREQY